MVRSASVSHSTALHGDDEHGRHMQTVAVMVMYRAAGVCGSGDELM